MPFALPVVFADPVTGAAAVALIIAGVLLAKMLGSLLPKFSILGATVDLGKFFAGIAGGIESWAIHAFDSVIAPVGNWLNGLAYDAYHNLSDTVDAIGHLGDQIAYIVTTSIPEAIAAQFSHIMGIVDSDIGAVYTKIDGAVSSLVGDISTAIAAQFSHIMGIVDSDIGAVRSYVDSAVNGAEAVAGTALRTVEQTLTGDIGTAIQTAEAAAAAAEAALSRDLGAAIAAAEAAAAAGIGIVTGEITSANAQIAAIAATAATALAVATTVAGEFESCAVTSCEGPNNLASLLNQLLGIISYADLAAFIGLAIGKPAQAAGEFASAAQGLYSDADSALNLLLSI